jgi:ABC-2 type transport system ATP-binding protein
VRLNREAIGRWPTQIVDLNTGRTLGNLVTPIPVKLDGGTHPVTVDMENIACTMHPAEGVNPADRLALQIVDSATTYENFTSFGLVNVSSIGLTLPTAVNVIPGTLQDLLLSALPR